MMNLQFIEKSKNGINKTIQFKGFEDFIFLDEEKYDIPNLPFKNLFNRLDYGIDILLPYNNGEDFIIINLFERWKSFGKNSKDFIGHLFGKSFPILEKVGSLDIIRNVYKTHNPANVKLFFNDDKFLKFNLDVKCIYDEGFIFLLSENKTFDYLINQHNNKLFNKYSQGIFYVRDKKILKKNDAFRIMEQENNSLSPFIYKDIKFENTTSFEWERIEEELLNREMISFSDVLIYINPKTKDKAFYNTYVTLGLYENEPALCFICVNITQARLAKIMADEYLENLDNVQKLSHFAVLTRTRKEFIGFNSEIYNILEIPDPEEIPKGKDILDDYVPADIKEAFYYFIHNSDEKNNRLSLTYPIITYEGHNKTLTSNVYFKRSKVGNPDLDEIISVVQDITDSVNIEKSINDANEELEKLLYNKEILLEEVQNRAKNNLQIILNLMNLDIAYNKNNPELVISDCRDRINSIALIHENVYKSESFDKVNIYDFIKSHATSMFAQINNLNIKFDLDVDEIELDMDNVVPLGLIINELLSNCINYAFPNGEKGEIKIEFHKNFEEYTLIVSDNGIGLPSDLDVEQSSTLGLTIINLLSSQLNGKLTDLKPLKGTSIQLKFYVKDGGSN